MRPFIFVAMACVFGFAALVFGTRSGVSAMFVVVLLGALASLGAVAVCGQRRGCPRCGRANRPHARFCAQCGHMLQ